jgi:hypothetical protein
MEDEQGGIIPENLVRAQRADLITLPKGIPGTNCGNCKFQQDGFCTHPEVEMPVTKRMCCLFWDADGTLRAWESRPAILPGLKMLRRKYGR